MVTLIIKQELSLAFSKLSNVINPLIFFFISISIFSISFGNLVHQEIYQQLNIAVIWFCLMFSILLGANHCFKEDFEDGTIEQLFMSGYMFELIVATKILGNWITHCLPLILVVPIAAIILKLTPDLIINLILVTAIVTLIISFIASFCSSLILGANAGYSLLTILVMPLSIPIIIFANSAFINFDQQIFTSSLQFLLAILVFLTPILIISTGAAIRLNID
ncbi:MAG: heme exporter protein CcmB [Proteobacteria bacterium]|nr:heme exporter protein CcmB [Pseudomonadota bacterium]